MGGLQSASEQHGKQEIPPEVKRQFLSEHAEANKKELQKDGKTYYSPFVSLTESLTAFINTSFGPRGDVNIRHDVLHRAPMLGAFDLPTASVTTPNQRNPDQSLPQEEKEILFDASTSTLADHQSGVHHNPFQGKVKIDYPKLLASRNLLDKEKLERARKYQDNDKKFLKTTSLSEEQISAYKEHLKDGEKFQNEIYEQSVMLPEKWTRVRETILW